MSVVRNWWLCVGLLWSSAVMAGPTLSHPDVSLGSNPIRSFSGKMASGETATLMEIPAGQDLVVTTFMARSSTFQLKRNEEVVEERWLSLAGKMFYYGFSRIVVPGGGTLRLTNTDSSGERSFRLEGFLIEAGGPYRTFGGEIAAATEVFENDTEQTFVVRAIHLSNTQCSVSLNDENVFRPTDLMLGGHTNNAYSERRGALLVPEGARLGVSPRPEVGVNTCEYYIEGDFVQP